jgi:2-dehydro-3-deoxyphosphogluconate aldolase / (4S)-4-hydroxy-2-oxoglutarate aldolase
MRKEEVRARIETVGIVPGVRVHSREQAQFAVEALYRSGIAIAEITMTVPGAIDLISHLTRTFPEAIVGAGTVLDIDTARRCLDAGARFLSSPGLVMEVVDFAVLSNVVVIPGALTPTEIIAAWKAGADLIKVFPCAQVGGPHYIRALKAPLPQVPLIASGGVNQQTAASFILAGASALGIGAELIPREALELRKEGQIFELARRFLSIVKEARLR